MLKGFYRSQITSGLGSAVDLGFFTIFLKLLHVHPWIATALGATMGGVANFLANRHWAFSDGRGMHWGSQAMRYALIWIGSLALNTGFVYWLLEAEPQNEVFSAYPVLTRLGIGLTVGLLFNFPLHRFFVFPLK